MPWPTGQGYASKHNKKLKGHAANVAARQATAMVEKGVPEGIAIATANKTGNRLRRRGLISKRGEERAAEHRRH